MHWYQQELNRTHSQIPLFCEVSKLTKWGFAWPLAGTWFKLSSRFSHVDNVRLVTMSLTFSLCQWGDFAWHLYVISCQIFTGSNDHNHHHQGPAQKTLMRLILLACLVSLSSPTLHLCPTHCICICTNPSNDPEWRVKLVQPHSLLKPALKASDYKSPTQYFEDTLQLVNKFPNLWLHHKFIPVISTYKYFSN